MAVNVKSKVVQLMVHDEGCSIKLEDPAHLPKSGMFTLRLNHPNYAAIYAAGVAAITNGTILAIRTEKDIVPEEEAFVIYVRLYPK